MKINHVFFLLPNLIGYIRALFYTIAFSVHPLGQWQLCITLYFIGFLLDEVDGKVAKKYNQKSSFGAALDMVLDRSATTGLCLILAQLYPAYSLGFILLTTLDISSHYYLLATTTVLEKSSHKEVESWSNNSLLHLYYGSKPVFDVLITGNELFYSLLYICYYTPGFTLNSLGAGLGVWQLFLLLCFPVFCFKQIVNLIQLQASASKIAAIDLLSRNEEKTSQTLSHKNPNG